MYDDMSIKSRTVLVSPEYLPSRGWLYYDAHEIERKVYRLFIPYQGDEELLGYRPNPFSLSRWQNFTISYGPMNGARHGMADGLIMWN